MELKPGLFLGRDEDSAAESVNFDFYEVTTEAARHLSIGKVHPIISKFEL